MEYRNLSEIQRRPVDQVLAGLKEVNPDASRAAALTLVHTAKSFGIGLKDYLMLSVKTNEGDYKGSDLNGYEIALAHLNLPIKNDFQHGMLLEAAGNTFQTYPGVRALFPEVVDDILKWANRQQNFETTAAIVANSRTITSVELISTIVDDDSAQRGTYTISEGANIPVRSIKLSQNSVNMGKHGSGYRTTYEFNRRARVDSIIPFANRVSRQLEISKVAAATAMLINGDGVNGPANEVNQSSFPGAVAHANGVLSYERLLRWLVARGQAGVPVDTVVGNFKAYVDWLLLFTPTLNGNRSQAEALAAKGGANLQSPSIPGLLVPVNFALSSTVPNDKLIGMTKGECVEELVEAGSLISESETAIRNQTITYVKSEVTGYKLAFGDAREVYNYGA
jgi:hypothetical protein